MLSALASGTLIREPKSGTSTSGTRWANCSIRCSTGTDREGAMTTAFLTVVGFGEVAEKLGRLGKGDSVAVQGSLKPTEFIKDGQTRHGLEIVAQEVLTPYQIKMKRGSEPRQDGPAHAAGAPDFDDPITF